VRRQLLLHLPPQLKLHLLEFLAQATTHSLQTRAWEFHARWLAPAITHSLQTKAWAALVQVDLVLLAQAQVQAQAHHVQADHVRPVAAHLVQVDLALRAELVLVLHDQVASLVQALQPVAHRVVPDQQVAQGAALAPQVHLVRAVQRTRLESQSAQREKNLSKDPLRALVVLLFQEETATLL
jgi:hypothetical protein